jgi:hypothetical protein
VTKNLVVMSLGTLAALAPAWRLSTELSGAARREPLQGQVVAHLVRRGSQAEERALAELLNG